MVTPRVSIGFRRFAEAWFEIDDASVACGETIHGRLLLQGRSSGVHRITHTRLSLKAKDADRSTYLHERALVPETLRVTADESFQFRFMLDVPWEVPLDSWLVLEAEVKSGTFWTDYVEVTLKPEPPQACAAAAEQFAALARMRIQHWRSFPGSIEAQFVPLDGSHPLRVATLALRRVQGDWAGELVFRRASPGPARETVVALPRLAKTEAELREQFHDIVHQARLGAGMEWALPVPAQTSMRERDNLPRASGLAAADDPPLDAGEH